MGLHNRILGFALVLFLHDMQSFQGQQLDHVLSNALTKVANEKVVLNNQNQKGRDSQVSSSGILVACTYAKFLVTLAAVT